MPNRSIASAYDQLAELWLDGHFDQANGVAQHLKALAFLSPSAHGKALNVGCGCSTRFNSIICSHDLQLEGVDISQRMVELARESDPSTPVHHADICEWPIPAKYCFITAWDSIWHVKLSMQRALMLKLLNSLELGGVFIFSAGGLSSPDEHSSTAMGPEVRHGTLGIPELMQVIHGSGCACRHLEFDHFPDKHVYLIVQRDA